MAITLLSGLPETVQARPKPTDADLVARAASGDQYAFECIMRANNRRLYRTARSILHNDDDAEEVLQDAYVKAYFSLAGFKARSQLSTWLTRIVINMALERKRKLAHDIQRVAASDITDWESATESCASIAAPRSGPEAMAMRRELGRLIQQHIEHLPEVFRIVFVLRALEELTVEEAAQCLDIPEATVRTRFWRARQLLREYAQQDIDNALDASFAFGGVRCDRTVAQVLARIRVRPVPSG